MNPINGKFLGNYRIIDSVNHIVNASNYNLHYIEGFLACKDLSQKIGFMKSLQLKLLPGLDIHTIVLDNYAKDLLLIQNEHTLFIYYQLQADDGEFGYMGGIPLKQNEYLSKLIKLPALLQPFFLDWFNGWSCIPGYSFGLLPINYVQTFETLLAKQHFSDDYRNFENAADWWVVMYNGIDSYICLHKDDESKSMAVFKDKPPIRNKDFFELLNNWIQMSLPEK